MTDLRELKEQLVQELKTEHAKMAAKELTPGCLDNVYKLIESIKGICKIEMLERGGDYSDSSNRQSYYSGRRWNYSRHDRMGQLEEEIGRLMETAPNDRVREALARAIDEMR